jgi:hypothetical protein
MSLGIPFECIILPRGQNMSDFDILQICRLVYRILSGEEQIG